MTMMNSRSINYRHMLALATLLAALSLLLLASPLKAGADTTIGGGEHGQQPAEETHLGGFRLSKLFDFGEYKRIYGKKYTSAVQELARMKLYLGGVLRVLIAAIKHRFFGKRYYLAVNRMTDWTDDEWHQVSVAASVIRGDKAEPLASQTEVAAKGERHFDAADVSDIDTRLPEMFRGQEATFQKFVDEIQDGQSDDQDHKLSATMLFRDPQKAGSTDGYLVPKSNNPNYEQAQVMSRADASEPTERPLDSSETDQIAHSSTGLLDNILDGLAFLFNAAEQASSDKKIDIFSDGPDTIFVDHRESGCLRPPGHQLECGSCYAFASLALYEYLFCMQQPQSAARSPVQFSVQYLVDCGPKRHGDYLKGCQGGNPIKVAEFVNQYGLELELNYPYAGEQQMCPYDEDEDPAKMGYIRVEEPGLESLKPVDFDDMLKRQPVLINIYPNSELKFYGGGIYDNYACEYKYGHAMLLVGSGRKDHLEYWIVRNSLGSEWGEQGYLLISKGAALNCLVDDGTTSHAKFPTAKVNPRYTKKDLAKLLPNIG